MLPKRVVTINAPTDKAASIEDIGMKKANEIGGKSKRKNMKKRKTE